MPREPIPRPVLLDEVGVRLHHSAQTNATSDCIVKLTCDGHEVGYEVDRERQVGIRAATSALASANFDVAMEPRHRSWRHTCVIGSNGWPSRRAGAMTLFAISARRDPGSATGARAGSSRGWVRRR